jgi:dipeptidyl aminopeptidase/acylaminoacyl peptidase
LLRRLSVGILVLLSLTLVLAQTPSSQPSVINPTDNLVVENIPPIPSEISEESNRYTEFRVAGIYDWHPMKREMLIGTRFGETMQIHNVGMPGGARTQLTFFPDRTSGANYPPNNDKYFIFSKDVGGGEWFQIYRYDTADGSVTLLTDGKSRNLGAVFSTAGDRIAYTSTRRTGKDTDFWVVNPSDPKSDRLLSQNEGGGWSIADWSPDDKTLLAANFLSINESSLYLVDAATGNRTELTPTTDAKVFYSPVGFSKHDKSVYIVTDKDSEFQRLAAIDRATKQLTILTPDLKWGVESAELSRDGRTIAFIVNENGISTLHLFDTATRKERPAPKLPVGVATTLAWHDNNRDLAIGITSARSPSDVYSIDTASGKVERWTYSETGGVSLASLPEPELVKWRSFDQREITGFLYKPLPKFTGKRPVIINIHGGPEGQARPTFLARNNYFLQEMGVAIIYPNVRGSTGYGKTFTMLDNADKREDSYKDIAALLDWIKTRPDLDADRIMVTGGSYGGHMTLVAATRFSDRIRCSLSVVGISNLVTSLENTEAYRRDLRRVEYGDERDPKMRAFLQSIAPMKHVTNITKPIFIVQGQNDPRVPISESNQIVKTLEENNTPVWYLVAKDEGHGFAKKKNQDFQFYATVLFIREHLLK